MNADVEKAVARMLTPLDESVLNGTTAQEDARCMALIAQALRDQEAEIARLNERMLVLRGSHAFAVKRAEKAEALLREIDRNGVLSIRVKDLITTHLGATHDH